MNRGTKNFCSCCDGATQGGGIFFLGLFLLALTWALTAQATEIVFPSNDLQALTSLHRGGSLADDFQPLPILEEQIHQDHEDPLELLEDLIMAENWESWRIFQGTPGAAVPLAATQLYILYSGKAGKRSPLKFGEKALKSPSVRVEKATETQVDVPSADEWAKQSPSKFDSLFRQGLLIIENKKGSLKEPFKPQEQGLSVLEFLFEGDGPLSGRPWTWENFLPRVLTITAYLVGGLMLIEFLHLVLLVGLRSLGRSRGAK